MKRLVERIIKYCKALSSFMNQAIVTIMLNNIYVSNI